jgi:hypothetical protein
MNAIGSDNLISEEYFPTLNCAYYDTSRWVSRSRSSVNVSVPAPPKH